MTALDLALPAAATLWGAAAGTLLPRAAYRFSAPAGERWRTECPAGHPLKGWLGGARCGACAAAETPHVATPAPARGSESTPAPDGGSTAEGDSACGSGGDLARVPDGGSAAEGDSGSGSGSGGDLAPVPVPVPVPVPDGGSVPGDRRPRAAYGPRTTPFVVASALVCALLAVATGGRPELGVWLLLAPVGVLLAAVDFRVQRLPDPLTLPLAAAALALLGAAALLPEHAGDWSTALCAAPALGAGYFALFLVNPGGMGFGDVKLALGAGAVLGWYGWPTVLLGTFAGFLFGALYGGALVVARRAGRRTAIAFGPFLIAGAFAALLVGAYTA
ncbi:prepilin peptidase [Streptomyces sp. NPDC001068]|uniref:prepilin peptidase n=1 Tax=Streptomyces sp. NPDC001068 TaxID=3364544 RepID=UPI00368312DA